MAAARQYAPTDESRIQAPHGEYVFFHNKKDMQAAIRKCGNGYINDMTIKLIII
jgi:hypothetical protein